jgi:site-specific DNA-methyltransferase (adenine-specific)
VTPLPNRLFYGDNLDVLKQHMADASVDLVYLDPPFNSKSSYFVEHDGTTGHRRRSIMTLQKRRSKPSPSSCGE